MSKGHRDISSGSGRDLSIGRSDLRPVSPQIAQYPTAFSLFAAAGQSSKTPHVADLVSPSALTGGVGTDALSRGAATVPTADRTNIPAVCVEPQEDCVSGVWSSVLAEILAELRKLRNDFDLVEDLQKQLDQLRSELIHRDVLRPVLVSLMELSEGLGVLSTHVGRKAKPMAREDIVAQLTRLSVTADRALKRHGVQKTVVSAGDCFKPELHAIANCVPAPTPAAIGTVSQVFQHAFVDDNGRALRLALVNVYSAS